MNISHPQQPDDISKPSDITAIMSGNTNQNPGNNKATIPATNTDATISGNSGNTSPPRKSLSEEELH